MEWIGLHVHVLCESGADALDGVLRAIEGNFGHLLGQIEWLNLGGGHLVTRKGYDLNRFIEIVKRFKSKYDLEIILEPGSAFAWQTGDLHTTVLDIVKRGGTQTAVIDASFTCHMPDCLEMPYRPEVKNASSNAQQYPYRYRLGGVSCLAGDFLEKYSFKRALGSRLAYHI